MDLKVRDVARLLNVPEPTVYRWVRSGVLPAYRVHDQYLFNRVELQEWADEHKRAILPELFAPEGSVRALPSLYAALERGGVFYQVPGASREEVLQAVCELPGVPPSVDRGLLSQLLRMREGIASTGVGHGIAIPHPRDPLVLDIEEPTVLLCLLQQPVDFGALDHELVKVLFVLLSPTVQSHLQMLSTLAFALHDGELKQMLRVAAPRAQILEQVQRVDDTVHRLSQLPPTPPHSPGSP